MVKILYYLLIYYIHIHIHVSMVAPYTSRRTYFNSTHIWYTFQGFMRKSYDINQNHLQFP